MYRVFHHCVKRAFIWENNTDVSIIGGAVSHCQHREFLRYCVSEWSYSQRQRLLIQCHHDHVGGS